MKYVADMKPQNVLYAKMLLSPVAHAKIKSIDTSEAEKVVGVRAIATYLNTSQRKYNGSLRFYEHKIPENEVIFSDTVRFVGDRVAAVGCRDSRNSRESCKTYKS